MSLVLLASGFLCPQTGQRPLMTGQTDTSIVNASRAADIRARSGMDLSDTTGFAARTGTLSPRKLSPAYPCKPQVHVNLFHKDTCSTRAPWCNHSTTSSLDSLAALMEPQAMVAEGR
ncbi:hypothetical protein EDB80DRAFT_135039 [Ilyonectria destructans]|nr:hypothetical protein EDB80DRAFT_135039 [Ilyonectria destructans]